MLILGLGQRINLSALTSRLFFSSPLFTQNALAKCADAYFIGAHDMAEGPTGDPNDLKPPSRILKEIESYERYEKRVAEFRNSEFVSKT